MLTQQSIPKYRPLLNSIIVGQGNIVSFLNITGSAEEFSITELGCLLTLVQLVF